MVEAATINRIAVVLIPMQACLDWINSYPSAQPMILGEIQRDPTVYLLPEGRAEPEQSVRHHYKAMFEQELDSWYTDPDLWPKDRSFKIFKTFFDVQICTMVFDLGAGMIVREED